MIVWGGSPGNGGASGVLNTGGRYNATTDTWTTINTTNAPSARHHHTAVWTGSKMIVWGGGNDSVHLNDGGIYDPASDSWAPINAAGAPGARTDHMAVWTGSQMIIWGGYPYTATGSRYDPVTNVWTAMANAPQATAESAAVWTGTEMIIWSGGNGSSNVNTGARYNPITNTWVTTSTTNAPQGRRIWACANGIWTGSEMLVWGGGPSNSTFVNTGGRYNPTTNTWATISTTNAPAARDYHTNIWAGAEMIVWGGSTPSFVPYADGARYDPVANIWSPITNTGAPAGRYNHTATWTESQMIVFGGQGSAYFNDTHSYQPAQTLAAAAPLITQQPISATVAPGQPVTFNVSAIGDPTLTYQWKKAGADIATATASSYSIASVQVSDAAAYTVVITNGVGNKTSAPAVLVVGTKHILYVKANAAGSNNGSSWANAFTSLNSALSAAVDGDEIWVAAGTYKPSGAGNRDASFTITKVLTILGGFVGNEVVASARNWNTNLTLLSGDLSGNDTGPGGNQGDNSKRVVVYEVSGNAVLDGFRITGGNAPGSPDAGGGVYIGGVAAIRNCTFSWNYALSYGGGLASYAFGALTLEGCHFHDNSAPFNGGGGMMLDSSPGSHCIIKRSLFANNSGSASGGALFHGDTTAYIENSVFTANSSGGGMQSGVAAGAIRGFGGTIWIANCTFSGNTNTRGTAGAISHGSAVCVNSIIIGSGNNPIAASATSHLLSDQTITGISNVVGTPTFASAASVLGADGVFGTADDGLHLLSASPGVDTANAALAPPYDAAWSPRPLGAGVDRGAYETLVPPQITTQPQSTTVAQGAAVVLQVTVSGVGPFTYQWKKDGVAIPGATSASYPIASTQPWHIGDYTVTTTDPGGQVISTVATLSITGVNSGLWRGLLAYFPFNGNANDQSVFGNNAAVVNAVLAPDKAGAASSAYSFNGTSSYMTVSGVPIPTDNVFTWSVWINYQGPAAKAIIERAQAVGVNLVTPHLTTTPDTSVQFGSYDFSQGGSSVFSPAASLTADKWTHLVATSDSSGVRTIYFDGAKVAEGTSPTYGTALALLIFGADRLLQPDNYFRGNMDSIRIYNRTLSSIEIQQLYASEDPDSDGDGIRDRFETGTGLYVSSTNTGTSPTNADTDGDGLSDGQEVNTYASNPNVKDSDSDGFEDGFEVSTGFNPASAASTPEALSSMLIAVEFRFNAANGITYRIESSTDLSTWTIVENGINGTGGTVVRFYSIEGQSRKFYRARRN